MRVGHVRLIGIGIAVIGIAATATVAGGRWFGIGVATVGALLAAPRGKGNDADFGGGGDSGGDGGGD